MWSVQAHFSNPFSKFPFELRSQDAQSNSQSYLSSYTDPGKEKTLV